jgi:uncharacterized protein YecE (DUF72 family)
MATLRVGCSGWQYKHWRGNFYPADVPTSRWLEHYATVFDTVELNNSFYRLPEAHSFEAWRQRVPPDFVYAVKASRYLTHLKKLKDPQPPIDLLFSRLAHLGSALGPVLYQLPPRFPINLDRLTTFLQALPQGFIHVIEFRDPSWYVEEVFNVLKQYDVSLCLHDMEGSRTGFRAAGPAVYIRFHGPQKYHGRYSDHRLAEAADWCAARLGEDVPVYAYFNNDTGGQAPRDALRFRDLVIAAASR